MSEMLEAQTNFSRLCENPYPGRGFVIGVSEDDGYAVQVYWIMGRRKDSRNRVFSVDEGRVYTEVADMSKLLDDEEKMLSETEQADLIAKKLENIIYNAMDEDLENDRYVVSNGIQTDDVLGRMGQVDDGFLLSLEDYEYESDGPNYTSRITALCDIERKNGEDPWVEITVLRRGLWGEGCERKLYQYEEIAPGFGYSVTTYSGDGSPLPSFRGDPLLMPIKGTIEEVAEGYWAVLNDTNRVSLAVKFIDLETGVSRVEIRNKYMKK